LKSVFKLLYAPQVSTAPYSVWHVCVVLLNSDQHQVTV
jgi:hypothetical protein